MKDLPNVKTIAVTHRRFGNKPVLTKVMLMDNGDLELYQQTGVNGDEIDQTPVSTLLATEADTKKLWEAFPSLIVE